MSILVTGATGFVGTYVVETLKEEYPYEELISLASSASNGVKWIPSKNYVFEPNYLLNNGGAEIESIIHIGAWTPKNPGVANSMDGAFSNIASTKALLDSNLPKLKRFIFCSTLDVYKNVNCCITEDTQVAPETLYGMSKYYCEEMVSTYAKNRRIKCQILRLGHIYGAGEERYRKVIPVMIENALLGNNITIFGDGEALRSFIHIKDVAKAVVASLKLSENSVINVVGDEPISIRNLAEMVCECCEKKTGVIFQEAKSENRNFVFNNSMMRTKLLNTFIPFREGLIQEIEYMRRKLACE